jgi:hypothetical protein
MNTNFINLLLDIPKLDVNLGAPGHCDLMPENWYKNWGAGQI